MCLLFVDLLICLFTSICLFFFKSILPNSSSGLFCCVLLPGLPFEHVFGGPICTSLARQFCIGSLCPVQVASRLIQKQHIRQFPRTKIKNPCENPVQAFNIIFLIVSKTKQGDALVPTNARGLFRQESHLKHIINSFSLRTIWRIMIQLVCCGSSEPGREP